MARIMRGQAATRSLYADEFSRFASIIASLSYEEMCTIAIIHRVPRRCSREGETRRKRRRLASAPRAFAHGRVARSRVQPLDRVREVVHRDAPVLGCREAGVNAHRAHRGGTRQASIFCGAPLPADIADDGLAAVVDGVTCCTLIVCSPAERYFLRVSSWAAKVRASLFSIVEALSCRGMVSTWFKRRVAAIVALWIAAI